MLTCPGKIIDANNELKTKSLGIKRQRDNSKTGLFNPGGGDQGTKDIQVIA
jgi:hypothetical protein